MTKFATIAAALMLSASFASAGEFDLSEQCYDAEHFSDIYNYAENIEYIGTFLNEVDGLGYQWESDVIVQNGQAFISQYNPYEHTTCVKLAEPGKRYNVTR